MSRGAGPEVNYDRLYKIVIVGDAGVGKTNMLHYYTHDPALPAVSPSTLSAAASGSGDEVAAAESFRLNRKPTLGVEFATKMVKHPDGTMIRAQLWDTAGQERYRAITNSYVACLGLVRSS